jgi:hypothetical protein
MKKRRGFASAAWSAIPVVLPNGSRIMADTTTLSITLLAPTNKYDDQLLSRLLSRCWFLLSSLATFALSSGAMGHNWGPGQEKSFEIIPHFHIGQTQIE